MSGKLADKCDYQKADSISPTRATPMIRDTCMKSVLDAYFDMVTSSTGWEGIMAKYNMSVLLTQHIIMILSYIAEKC